MSKAFRLTIDSNNIATLTFDIPDEKINAFTSSILEELFEIVNELDKNNEIKALVILSGKEGVFIAGANLHELESVMDDPEKAKKLINFGHRVFRSLEKLPFPKIAVIEGACLGGGLEFALACSHRVVTDHPKTSIGLPEVNLGIFPGWGGTQRLPRLIGLENALKMILTGKPVNAKKALKLKLADKMLSSEFLEEELPDFITNCINENKKKNRSGLRTWLIEKNPFGRWLLFYQSKKNVLNKTKGHYPAPLITLELIRKTWYLPLQQGLDEEIACFIKNLTHGFVVAKQLIWLFFQNEALKKYSWVSGTFPDKNFKQMGVIGAGTMGAAISFVGSYRNLKVRFKDVSWKQISAGYGHCFEIYSELVKKRILNQREALIKFHNLSATLDLSGFHHADIVIEAAVENMDIKKKIFTELEETVPPDCLLATNTSSLSVTEIAKSLQQPERFLGIHFFNPANRMPLVEVAKGEATSDETLYHAIALIRKLKKVPIVVKDCPGYLVNRIFAQGILEVLWLVEYGASFDVVEKSLSDFGLPMSPFRLTDEVGIDVMYKVLKIFIAAYGPRMNYPKYLEEIIKLDLLGKKSGRGFYLYEGKNSKVNPDAFRILNRYHKKNLDIKENEVVARTLAIMINEATRCLEEEVVTKHEHIDMAMILGMGFPPFRGGLLRYADTVGVNKIVDLLNHNIDKGDRYKPSAYLEDLAKQGRTFY